ncbi:MAG: GIY-YIG nuclease family protein [Desulfamplus sp.]|nr:GIY-YIG nuclease family protein [Desulfamplus sp.]
MGAASRSAKARPVDFREQRGIYALYADYDLVYVGQTGSGSDRLFNRLKAHKSDHLSERWNRFSWFGTQWVTKTNILSSDTETLSQSVEATLNILEAVSIAISEPRLNLQRGKWGDTTQYFQWRKREENNDDDD